jgi:chlorophyll synthase
LGVDNAALVACWMMAMPQFIVIVRVLAWGRPIYAGLIALSLLVQIALMVRLLRDPAKYAPWYNATGTGLYVLGMLAAAFAVRPLVGAIG